MPFYPDIIARMSKREARRALLRTLDLRLQLRRDVPAKTGDAMLFATWNIRNLGASTHGARLDEAILHIAEIVNAFDIVDVQEVRRRLAGLERVMRVLGGDWSYLVSDVTLGRAGNDERTAFIYDNKRVRWGGLARELVLPPVEIREGRQVRQVPAEQIVRTPSVGGFIAGWSRFMLATVHTIYGTAAPEDPRRVREIEAVAQLHRDRADHEGAWARRLILLGNFNIFDRADSTYQALVAASFDIPGELQNLPGSNVARTKFYDQIALRSRASFDLASSANGQTSAGVFGFYESVFRLKDQASYRSDMGKSHRTNSRGELRPDTGRGSRRSYYRTYWRTHQMSDHLPMWTHLKTDYTTEYLSHQLRMLDA